MISLSALQAAFPSDGLFAGKSWYFSPEPLVLENRERRELERMGPTLAAFQEAQDRIYRRSVKGRIAPWVAELLDNNKPEWMREWQRGGEQAEEVPRVIRPDLLLTEEGFAITELDSVPGGMGLTAWLGSVYPEVMGGADGILQGLRAILPAPETSLWISDESGDYRPEMRWLANQLSGVEVKRAEEWDGTGGYRFFELFDWESIPNLSESKGKENLTPPIKPLFEEKIWLALLHTPGLKKIWEQELRGKHFAQLKKWTPMGWVLDPTPLPPHAALPKLDVNGWEEVGTLSQRERRLVLKISGFNELAWGSRGVHIGHDESREHWQQLVTDAVADFTQQPWMMQQFREAKLIEHPYYDESGQVRIMKGRARLCPYYFLANDQVMLGGCLATIVPADKKKIHGMEDAILVPVA